jgi:hypothetical protein
LKRGDVFNAQLLEVFFRENAELLPPGSAPEKNALIVTDNQAGTVDITLDFALPPLSCGDCDTPSQRRFFAAAQAHNP